MHKNDIFKDQLKSAFSDFEAPVPSDGWEKMEQSLNAIARAKIVRRNWYIGSAAATVAILLGSLFFLRSPQPIEQSSPTLTEGITSNKAIRTDKQDVRIADADPISGSKKNDQQKLTRKKQEILIAKQAERKESESEITDKTIEQAPDKFTIAEQPQEKRTEITEEKTQPEEKQVSQPNQDEIDRLIREFENAGKTDVFGVTLEEKRSKPLMLALNAKGGLASSQKTVVNSPMTLRSASVEKLDNNLSDGFFYGSVGKSNNISSGYENVAALNTRSVADNVAEMEHDQPVSFGITISKTIIDKLSIETGIVYTYLFSRAKNTSVDFQNQETQHFHYLGIPVNFNYNFLNFGRLGLFTSVGGMIEKDVYGEFRSSGQVVSAELNSSSQGVITTKISQKNPQLSVNAGVGAFYPIYGGFNLYGKLGGSYYFDAKNNEYKTIYTDKKIVLDLNAGIRFDF